MRLRRGLRLSELIDTAMGDVHVDVELENYADRVLAQHGHLDPERIRSERVSILVDSGATLTVLPQDLVDQLGLATGDDRVIVTYADERTEERPVAGVLTVRVGDRHMETDCVVGPPKSEPLLGQIVLERLDLMVDCADGTLVPKPESPYWPALKLK